MVPESFRFEYRPALGDAVEFLRDLKPLRFLVLGELIKSGEGLPDGFENAGECRHLEEPEVQLPRGSYHFHLESGHSVMLVTSGTSPCSSETGGRTLNGSTPLEKAARWMECLWDQSKPIPSPIFSISSMVMVGQSEGSVRSRRYFDGVWQYGVRVEGRTQNFEERFLTPFDEDTDPIDWISGPPGTAREITATLTRAKLEEHLTDTVYSFRASRTIFMPYQFRPVIKMLRTGARRLLIADEVGMGKTIEAGLVWSEFEARGLADRVLVVCPSGLVDKWKMEMQERFNFDVQKLTRDGLDDMLDRFETDRFPRRYHAVCSLHLLRSWEHLKRLNDLSPRFDMIVVDEAHALRNTGTMSSALGSLLSDWADILLFLSATPLNLGNDDLFNLLHLIEPGEFNDKHTLKMQLEPNSVLTTIYRYVADRSHSNSELRYLMLRIPSMIYGSVLAERREFKELSRLLDRSKRTVEDIVKIRQLCLDMNTLSTVLTRTRRSEIEAERPVRQPYDIPVELTEKEHSLYKAVRRWQEARAEAHGMPLHFIGQMPLRLAGSCLQAIRHQILQRHSGGVADDVTDEDGIDEDEPESDPWEPPPDYAVTAARNLGEIDTKFEEFVEALGDMVGLGRRVLVFTFSRPVVAYLQRRLSSRFSVEVLHGGLAGHVRRKRIAEFRDGKFDVMLATRVASEGLDFEFCEAVINYDLPWNPMELEQRIGRIDRFGQQSDKVYILNFTTPGTIETDIIHRVHERIGVFIESIGELEPILQAEFPKIKRMVFDFSLTPEEIDRRIEAALLATENTKRLQREFDDSSAILNISNLDSMGGFESKIVNSGHYVGQPELARLIVDWASTSKGASYRLSDDSCWLYLRGNAELENDLRQVQAAGERSSLEVDRIARDLRDNFEIHLCLDQELARHQCADLLNASHVLVRAALKAKRSGRMRFGAARIKSMNIASGRYLVLVGIAKWNGLRPAAELWTAACDGDGQEVGDEVGAELLAALAEASLDPVSFDQPIWDHDYVHDCKNRLLKKRGLEQQRREQDDAVYIEARRVSMQDSHERKIRGFEQRIDSLKQGGKLSAVRLLEAQLSAQQFRLREAEQKLQDCSKGSLSLEYIAICSLEAYRDTLI